ncbi:hypothetical protein LSH36_1491g00069 [Paralvinella palmiformis]|uniref:Peptidoglycan recognition protein family domain-containing protein n=1 Tax=Paralvinella palmiformis TaxID=53620 RepID=A0AAD9MMX7_9ANNE|nr:hypothetical protein LSH36_1491g00069 [Paralvinella palmiformis]
MRVDRPEATLGLAKNLFQLHLQADVPYEAMFIFRMILPVLMVAVLSHHHLSEAGWVRWSDVAEVAASCYLAGCFSKQQMGHLCGDVGKAMIKRDEWGALNPRQEQVISGIADNVIVYHTGSGTCNTMGFSGQNCQQCLQDESCAKQAVLALQDQDMSSGKDDIRYNFLIDQNGVIYEGRGWSVVGQHTTGRNDKTIGIGMLGDFSSSEPSLASQTALKNLISCGEAAGVLSRGSDFTTGPAISGKAFYDMVQRCRGLCSS